MTQHNTHPVEVTENRYSKPRRAFSETGGTRIKDIDVNRRQRVDKRESVTRIINRRGLSTVQKMLMVKDRRKSGTMTAPKRRSRD